MMKNALLIIGGDLKYLDFFIKYLKKEVKHHLGSIEQLCFIDKNNKNMFLFIEDLIEKNKNIVIASSKQNIKLTNKIISTITEDPITLKNNMLMPSKVSIFSKNSYLLDIRNRLINILLVDSEEKIPKILIKVPQKNIFINILNIDQATCYLPLNNLAEKFKVKVEILKIINEWALVKIVSSNSLYSKKLIEAIRENISKNVIEGENVVKFIVKQLKKKGRYLTCSESCTGGLLSSAITDISGSSSIFKGSFIVYSNLFKEHILGVKQSTLKKYGAVSKECVKEMLDGSLYVADADIAIAISGIAGPRGGSGKKPVGTVFIGAKNKEGNVLIEKLSLNGDRLYIKRQSVLHALKLVLKVDNRIFFKHNS